METNIKTNINSEVSKSSQVGMALAIQRAIARSVGGSAFDPRNLDQESLLAIKRAIDKEAEWRERPNTDKSYC